MLCGAHHMTTRHEFEKTLLFFVLFGEVIAVGLESVREVCIKWVKEKFKVSKL